MGIENFYISQLQNPDTNPFGTLQIMIPEVKTDLGKLISDTQGNSKTYTFAIADSLSVSMQANWAMDATAEEYQGKLDKMQNTASGVVGGAASVLSDALNFIGLGGLAGGVQNMAAKRIKPLKTTYLSWQKSDTSPFSFKITKIALTPDDDTVKPFRELSRMVLPSYFSAGIVMTPGQYTPPYGENAWDDLKSALSGLGDIFKGKEAAQKWKGEGYVNGTVTVKYGEWAVMRNLLVTSLNFTASKVCTKYGLPLYTTGKIDLIPFRMLLADDIDTMFNRGEWQKHKINDDYYLANTYGANDIPPELFRGKKAADNTAQANANTPANPTATKKS